MKTKEIERDIKYITQYRRLGSFVWFDRFTFDDVEIAKIDLKSVKDFNKNSTLKYEYRLISKETVITEYEVE